MSLYSLPSHSPSTRGSSSSYSVPNRRNLQRHDRLDRISEESERGDDQDIESFYGRPIESSYGLLPSQEPLTPQNQGYELKSYELESVLFLQNGRNLPKTETRNHWSPQKQRMLDENVARTHRFAQNLLGYRPFQTDQVIVESDKVTIFDTLTKTDTAVIYFAGTPNEQGNSAEAREIIRIARLIYGYGSGNGSSSSSSSSSASPLMSPITSRAPSPRPFIPAPRVDERDDLEDEIETLTSQRDNLNEELDELNGELAELGEAIDQATDHRRLLREENDDLDEQIGEKRTLIEDLGGDEERLTTQIAELEERKRLVEENIDRLTRENQDLTERNAELVRKRDQLKEEIRDLKNEKATLGREIAAAKDEVKALKRNIAKLRVIQATENFKLQKLTKKFEQLQREVEALELQKAELEHKVSELRKEEARLLKGNADLEDVERGLKADIQDLDRDKGRLEADLKKLNEQIRDAKLENEQLNAANLDLTKRNAQLEEKIRANQELLKKLEAAKETLIKDITGLESRKAELEASIRDLTEETDRLEEMNGILVDLNKELSTEKNQLDAEIEALNEKSDTLKERIAALELQIQSSTEDKAQLERDIEHLRGEFASVTDLREALDKALTENAQLRLQVAALKEDKAANLQTIDNLRSEVAQLKAQLQEAQATNNASSEQLKAALIEAMEALEAADSQSKLLAQDLGLLFDRLKLAKQENEQLLAENLLLRSTLEEKEAHLVNAQAAAQAKALEISKLAKQIQSLRNEFPRSLADEGLVQTENGMALVQTKKEFEQATNDLLSLEKLIAALRKDLESAQTENEELHSLLEDRDVTILGLENRHAEESRGFQQQLEGKEAELTEVLAQLATKSQTIGNLQQKNIRQALRLEELAAMQARYKKAYEQTDAENRRLENLLAGQKATILELRGELAEVKEDLASLQESSKATFEENKTLARTIKRLEKEAEALQAQIAELEASNDNRRNEIQYLYSQRKQLEGKIASLTKLLEDANLEIDDLNESLATITQERDELLAKNEGLESDVASLRNQVKEQEAELEKAGQFGLQLIEKNGALETENAALLSRNATLVEQQRKERFDFEAQARKSALEIAAAKAETLAQAKIVSATKEELAAQEVKAAEALKQKDLRIKELEALLAASESQVTTLTDTNGAQAREIESLQSQNASLKKQIGKLEETIRYRDHEILSLTGERDAHSQEKDKASLEFERQIQDLREKLEASGKANAELKASLEKQIQELKLAQQRANEGYEVTFVELSEKIISAKAEKERLEESLELFQAQNKALESQNDSLRSENEKTRQSLESSKRKVERLGSEVQRLEAALSEKDADIEKIKDQLALAIKEKDAALREFEKERAGLLKKINELELENARQKKTITDSQRQLLAAGEDIAARKKSEENYKRDNEQLNQDILNMRLLLQKNEASMESLEKSLESKIASLIEALQRTGKEKQELSELSATLTSQIDALERANSDLSTSNALNAAELEKLQAERDALIEELLAPDQTKPEKEGDKATKLEFLARVIKGMTASDLSGLTPEQLRALHTNYLLLHLDIDVEEVTHTIEGNKSKGISFSFEKGFTDPIITDFETKSRQTTPTKFTQAQVAAKANTFKTTDDAKHRALSSFATQLNEIQSPVIEEYNVPKKTIVQKVNHAISSSNIDDVIKKLYNFDGLVPSELLIILQADLDEVKGNLNELKAATQNPATVRKIRELNKQQSELNSKILLEMLRLNIIRICSTDKPWFPKEIISLRIMLNDLKLASANKKDSLNNLNNATTSTLKALKSFFDQINVSQK